MNKKKKRIALRLLYGALGLLGFTACSSEEEEHEIICEYGTPSIKFQAKGTVTSEANEPLKGIQVIVRSWWDNAPLVADTLYTDEKGEFQTQNLNTGGDIDKQKIYFNDIDGEENGGAFKSDSIALKDMNIKQIEKGSGWDRGTYEITPKSPIKLSKKDN